MVIDEAVSSVPVIDGFGTAVCGDSLPMNESWPVNVQWNKCLQINYGHIIGGRDLYSWIVMR